MKVEQEVKLDFIDVLIRPKRSALSSRSEVSMERTIHFKNSNTDWTGVPIIAANMDTVGTFEMYYELSKHKMITCFSKHYDVSEYPEDLNREYYMISTGINENDWKKLVSVMKKLHAKFIVLMLLMVI